MFTPTHFRAVACAVALFAAVPVARAENWPQWRGADFTGVSQEKSAPIEWGPQKNVLWKRPLPGPAGATPVVWGENVFLTSVDGEELVLLCIGTADGHQRWRATLARGNQSARGDEGNSASPSPVTDGKHVWSFMGTGDLACYTVGGEKVWQTNLQDRFGKFDIQFGMSSTPVLHRGKLLFQLLHGSMSSQDPRELGIVAALDAATGDTLWKTPRKTGAVQENKQSYASPMFYDFDGLTLLITHGGDHTIAYAPETGKEVWRLGNYNPQSSPKFNPYLRFVASPGIGEGIVVCPTAKGGPVYAIRPDAMGNVPLDGDAVLWNLDKGTPDVPTPLVHDGLVYLCGEQGILRCIDVKSGETYYTERTHNARYRASPIYAAGHVYITARDGKVTVVKAGKTFEIVAQNDTGEEQSSTPVLADGTLYLRTFDALWAIGTAKR